MAWTLTMTATLPMLATLMMGMALLLGLALFLLDNSSCLSKQCKRAGNPQNLAKIDKQTDSQPKDPNLVGMRPTGQRGRQPEQQKRTGFSFWIRAKTGWSYTDEQSNDYLTFICEFLVVLFYFRNGLVISWKRRIPKPFPQTAFGDWDSKIKIKATKYR